MTSRDTGVASGAGQINGHHVLAALLGFFGIVFAVNGYFTYAAFSTYTGLVANEPYRKGLAYNSRIAADERQISLGWRETFAVTRDGRVALAISDRDGTPIHGLKVIVVVGRPSMARLDRTSELAEQPDGRYLADIGGLDNGNWIATIEARDKSSAEPVFRFRRRLWLKP